MPDCRSNRCRKDAKYMVAQFQTVSRHSTKDPKVPVWRGWFCQTHLNRCLPLKISELMAGHYIKVKKVV